MELTMENWHQTLMHMLGQEGGSEQVRWAGDKVLLPYKALVFLCFHRRIEVTEETCVLAELQHQSEIGH